jgi:alpha/beta superfamily hydrolase
MRQQSIAFKGRKLTLEGIVTLPTDRPSPFSGVVLCHAHPLFGENMESPVMQALCRALDGEGIATLRFNFRGVGGSGGSFDRGIGEQDDLKAAIDTLKRWPGVNGKRIAVAGVSFGAVVALDVLTKTKGVEALAAVAPTISGVRRSRLDKFKGAKLLMVGEKDRLVPSDELSSVVTELSSSVEYIVVPGADHTWVGYEDRVAAQVAGFMVEALQ